MPSTTTNYNLKKPIASEYFNVEDQNGNMDLIDAVLTPTADPAQVPAANTGKLGQWVSWFVNRIKAITGGTNWYDAPTITLKDAANQITAEVSARANADTTLQNNITAEASARSAADTALGNSINTHKADYSHHIYYAADSGMTDTYAIAIDGVTAYSQLIGVSIFVKCPTANTTAATLNINGLGDVNIVRGTGTALLTGDITAGKIIQVLYDGTSFQLLSQGVDASQASKSETLTNKTLTSPTLNTPTLSNPKMTSGGYLADPNGNELIKFPSTVASAVNEVTVSNAATGSGPSIASTGGDADISFDIKSKGAGLVRLFVGSLYAWIVKAETSAVNYLVTTATANGSNPKIESAGTDANIGINLITKGTGVVQLNGQDPLALIGTHTANTNNPHTTTAAQVGLGNVTNESKATMFTSPAFTGNTPTAAGNMMYHVGNVTISTTAPTQVLSEGYMHMTY